MYKKHLKAIKRLYNPSERQIELTHKIASFIKDLGYDGIDFDKPFDVNGLSCRSIVVENTPTYCLIQWMPNFDISRTNDPCCSAFILTIDELETIYTNLVKAIKGNSYTI